MKSGKNAALVVEPTRSVANILPLKLALPGSFNASLLSLGLIRFDARGKSVNLYGSRTEKDGLDQSIVS